MMLVEWNLHGAPFRQSPLSCIKRTFSRDWKDVTFWCQIVLMEDIKTEVGFEHMKRPNEPSNRNGYAKDMKLYKLR